MHNNKKKEEKKKKQQGFKAYVDNTKPQPPSLWQLFPPFLTPTKEIIRIDSYLELLFCSPIFRFSHPKSLPWGELAREVVGWLT